MFESVHNVVRKAGQQVDDKPALQIIHADDFGIRDHFAAGSHERCVEVEHNIDEEDDVDDAKARN